MVFAILGVTRDTQSNPLGGSDTLAEIRFPVIPAVLSRVVLKYTTITIVNSAVVKAIWAFLRVHLDRTKFTLASTAQIGAIRAFFSSQVEAQMHQLGPTAKFSAFKTKCK